MGVMDNARQKAQEFADKNPDKVEHLSDQAIDRAGEAVDSKTGGTHSEHIDKAEQAADRKIGQ